MRKFLNIYMKTAIFFGIAIILIFCAKTKSNAELPKVKILGGSYEDVVHQDYDHEKFHVHHLISRQAWNRLGKEILSTEGSSNNSFITQDSDQTWAPAILMEKQDHIQTRSYKNSQQVNYETDQLLKRGAVMQLLNEECDDIRKKFGDKYDKAIIQIFDSIRGQFVRKENILLICDAKSTCTAKYSFAPSHVSPRKKTAKRLEQPLSDDIRKYLKIIPTKNRNDTISKSTIPHNTVPKPIYTAKYRLRHAILPHTSSLTRLKKHSKRPLSHDIREYFKATSAVDHMKYETDQEITIVDLTS